jgi:hypothetical protein
MTTANAPALIVYGATGYTGRLIAEQAACTGLSFTVAGRDPAKVKLTPGMFDLGAGEEEFGPVPMGDLVTVWHPLGLDDIEVFMRSFITDL